jgi:hypothetical protein
VAALLGYLEAQKANMLRSTKQPENFKVSLAFVTAE